MRDCEGDKLSSRYVSVKYSLGSTVRRTTIIFTHTDTSVFVSLFGAVTKVSERQAEIMEYQMGNWGYDITDRDIFDISVREGEEQWKE